jgi:1,2-diacylglycerol 3-beta-galactosyltransferase
MVRPNNQKPKILVLFSDTGGGHRSAAEAVLESLGSKHPDEFEVDMVDVFRAYAPYPLNRMPELYPEMVKLPQLWRFGYRMVDGRARARMMMDSLWPWVRPACRQLVHEHPADLVLNVHPLFNTPMIRALGRHRPPFITVVTDLITTPIFWYYHRVDVCVVPTQEARRIALRNGMKPEQIKLLGLPVGKKFGQPVEKKELRRQLDWPTDRPMVFLIGGGDGMGPIYETARAIAHLNPEIGLAVVAGRNEKLKANLENNKWGIPVRVYGFAKNMPDLMRAADILVTKAGPGTICEALNAGLPMVLYSRIPGQEEGNVQLVVEEGAGRWAPSATKSAQAVHQWIQRPEQLEKAAQACKRIAYPNAADDIADLVWKWLPHSEMDPLKS